MIQFSLLFTTIVMSQVSEDSKLFKENDKNSTTEIQINGTWIVTESSSQNSGNRIEKLTFLNDSANHHVLHQETNKRIPNNFFPCLGPRIKCKGSCILNVQYEHGNMDVRGNNRNSIEKDQITNTTAITFCNNGIDILDINLLFMFPNVQSIDFSVNNIGSVDLSRVQLTHLQKINGSFNKLTNFIAKKFNVSALYLNDNRIENITFVSTMNKLEVLRLSNNYISTIPTDTFLNLTQLKCLYLENNNIKDLSFVKLLSSAIFYADISRNEINNISHFKKKTSLRVLNLSSNMISELNLSEISIHLHALNSSNNRISRVINAEAMRQSFMINLDLRNNFLPDVNFLFYINQRLRYLFLSNNKGIDISSVKYLKSVTLMDLSNTSLNSVDPISRINTLQGLKIDKNNVSLLPLHIFSKKFEALHISDNPLGKLLCNFDKQNLCKILRQCDMMYERDSGYVVIDLYMKDESINKRLDCVLKTGSAHLLSKCSYKKSFANANKSVSKTILVFVCTLTSLTFFNLHLYSPSY